MKARPSGCLGGFFKILGGLIGGVVGLLFAVSFLANEDKRDPIQELESRCGSAADSYPNESQRQAFYSNCVSSGKAKLKLHGL